MTLRLTRFGSRFRSKVLAQLLSNNSGVPLAQYLRDGAPFYAPRTSSITQTRGSGTPTITRATTATVMGYAPAAVLADGQTLLTVASGELRLQGARRISEGVWSTVDAAGVPIPAATLDGSVVEAAATNLRFESNTLTTAPWVGTGDAPVKNAIGPNGQANYAWTGTDSSVVAATRVQNPTLLTAATYTAQFKVKKTVGVQTSYPVYYELNGPANRVAACTVDTTNGVATVWTAENSFTVTTSSASCRSYNTDFWLVELTFLADASNWGGSILFAGTTNATKSSGDILEAAAQGSAVVCDFGVELGSYATSYQATTTAAVTRNKDVLDDQVASNLTAAAGSVAFQWTPSHAPSGTVALAGSYVDASNYTALLHDGTKYIFRKRIAASNYDAELTAAFVSGTTYDIALRWGASGTQIAVDGVLGTAHANTTAAQLGTRWQWGADGNSAQQAGAAFKEKRLWTKSLNDIDLQVITR